MEPEQRAAAVRALASKIYGTYVALCYLSPLLGGWLADRHFGLLTMLFAGCVCITLGHALMVRPDIKARVATIPLPCGQSQLPAQ